MRGMPERYSYRGAALRLLHFSCYGEAVGLLYHPSTKRTRRDSMKRGMTRREMLHGLALAAAAAATTDRIEAAGGLKAIWVNHYTYVAPDLKKTADWYREVFGMQIGHQDAKQAHLWYGDKGFDTLMIIRQANPGEDAP